LASVQDRITKSAGTKFVFECTDEAKEFLLREGIDLKYGARHLKRAIERFLVYPLSNLVATQQIETGDLVLIDFDDEKLVFSKKSGEMIVSDYERQAVSNGHLTKSDGVGLPLPQVKSLSEKSKSTSETNEV
jgi:hypothetical protein